MINLIYNGEKEKTAIKDVFAKTLETLFHEDKDVVYFDADLMNSMGTYELSQRMPDRCIDCGIQEANMIGVAAGTASLGKKPYVHTFGAFAGRRCFDQVFMSAGYAKNNIRIIGSDAGVSAAYNGGTHMPFEDVAIYRSLPDSMIIDAVDSVQFAAALRQTKDRDGTTYIRCHRKNCVAIYGTDTTFEFGKANVLREGKDCVIIASGIMLANALEAAILLEKENISVAVIDPVTVKPLDRETVVKYAKQCGCVVTAENANYIGGLGGAVSEVLGEAYPVPVKRVGVCDQFGEVGDEAYLRSRFGLTTENIINNVKSSISQKRA